MNKITPFINFYTERLRDKKVKIKPKDKSFKSKGPRSMDIDKRTKLLSGINRKHLNMVPDIHKLGSTGTIYSSIEDVIKRAKEANRGIWRVSKRQVLDISKKYQFAIPNDHFPTKHLGSSGIILWRKAYNKYFLVKFKKQTYKR